MVGVSQFTYCGGNGPSTSLRAVLEVVESLAMPVGDLRALFSHFLLSLIDHLFWVCHTNCGSNNIRPHRQLLKTENYSSFMPTETTFSWNLSDLMKATIVYYEIARGGDDVSYRIANSLPYQILVWCCRRWETVDLRRLLAKILRVPPYSESRPFSGDDSDLTKKWFVCL